MVTYQIKWKERVGPYSSLYGAQDNIACQDDAKNRCTALREPCSEAQERPDARPCRKGHGVAIPGAAQPQLPGQVAEPQDTVVSFCLRKRTVSLLCSEEYLHPMHFRHRKHFCFLPTTARIKVQYNQRTFVLKDSALRERLYLQHHRPFP